MYPPPSAVTFLSIWSTLRIPFKSVICEEKNVNSKMLINVLHTPGILQPLRGSHHPPDWPRPQGALSDDRLTQEVSQILVKSVCIIRWTSFSNAIILDPDPTFFLFADPDPYPDPNADPDPDPYPNADPDLDPVPDPRFWWPKIGKKITAGNFLFIFLIKIAIYLSLGIPKGLPSYMRSLQPSKENIQHFKTWKIFTFLFLWVIFVLNQLKLMRIHVDPDADPDPQPWL